MTQCTLDPMNAAKMSAQQCLQVNWVQMKSQCIIHSISSQLHLLQLITSVKVENPK